MELFWCRGYEITSIHDLLDRLEISRASLYATFGGKRQRYLLALERYRTRFTAGLVERLDEADPVLPALREVLVALTDEALADSERRAVGGEAGPRWSGSPAIPGDARRRCRGGAGGCGPRR
jgi:TetR/AcrR family transcriptional repressor of nem operon